jgi:hypothetical protein
METTYWGGCINLLNWNGDAWLLESEMLDEMATLVIDMFDVVMIWQYVYRQYEVIRGYIRSTRGLKWIWKARKN